MYTKEEIKQKLEEYGYYATDKIVWEAYLLLYMYYNRKTLTGQDIYTVCFDGPPGSGKTEFAKVYAKLAHQLFKEEIYFIDYQCDAQTGKTELCEDINISAAIKNNADNVIISGKLIEAINKVNEGKKVILFIDEYDKAREETDSYLLQFLQSGKINATQSGDLEIKDQYKSNLQVILCKNDNREKLSGPLTRRIEFIRLESMEPTVFYKVAKNVLVNQRKDSEKISDGLINLVSLMYENIYNKKDLYDRVPACSELLIAIELADVLLKSNAPQWLIYNKIITTVLKTEDDIKTFESSIEKEKNTDLSNLITSMKSSFESVNNSELNDLIAQKVLVEKSNELDEKINELKKLIDEYKTKFDEMEAKRKAVIEQEIKEYLIETGKIVNTKIGNVQKIFEDESLYIKRGYDIFNESNEGWIDVATIKIPRLSTRLLYEYMIKYAAKLNIKIYENGVLIKDDGDIKLIMFNDIDEDKNIRYRFMTNNLIIPYSYLREINNFIELAESIYKEQVKTAKNVTDDNLFGLGNYDINFLGYNQGILDFEKIDENVYHVEITGQIEKNKLNELCEKIIEEQNNDFIIEASKKLKQEKKKVLTNE